MEVSDDRKRRRRFIDVSVVDALRRGPSVSQSRLWDVNGKPRCEMLCPSCGVLVKAVEMNNHLDKCLHREEGTEHKTEARSYLTALEATEKTAERLENIKPATNGEGSTIEFNRWKATFPRVNMTVDEAHNETKEGTDQYSTESIGHVPYYLRAFLIVLNSMKSTHGHLLNDCDRALLNTFEGLSQRAKKLFVRVYKRKSSWYRPSELARYENDIEGKVDNALQEMIDVGLLETADRKSILHATEILPCLKADEIRKLVGPIVTSKKPLSKAAAEDLIHRKLKNSTSRTVSGHSMAQSTAERIVHVVGRMVRLVSEVVDVFDRAHTLFFTLDRKDSPSLLLADLGKTSFPTYICRTTRPTFPSRRTLDEYLDAKKLEEKVEEALFQSDFRLVLEIGSQAEEKLREYFEGDRREVELEEQLQHPFLRRLSHLWVLAGVAWHSVAVQERLKDHDGAVRRLELILRSRLTPNRRGKMLNRLTIDLKDHTGKPEVALEKCLEGLKVDEEWSIHRGERIQLAKRAKRLWTMLKKQSPMPVEVADVILADSAAWSALPQRVIFGRPLDEYRKEGAGSVFIGYDGERVSVEVLCLQSYRAEAGWIGAHCEGSILRSLFGLLCWDVLFSDVPDVFRTPFQNAPLDLGTEAFYISRRTLLHERLVEIEDMSGETLEIETARLWKQYEGIQCRVVSWNKDQQTILPRVARCVGGKTLTAVFRLLSMDYTYWSGGMPDLLLWKEEEAEEAMFVEVKGPRDTLMERQRAWIHELLASGAKVEVCKVVERVTDRNQHLLVGDHDGHELKRLEK